MYARSEQRSLLGGAKVIDDLGPKYISASN